jgi:hypothetical protein
MGNFIVAKGLGGPLMATQGWGASGIPNDKGWCVLKSSVGGLRVFVKKDIGNTSVRVTVWDGLNQVVATIPATADQLSGTDWMIIKVSRSGTNMIFTLDKSEPVTVSIGSLVSYSGNITLMDEAEGSVFDPRIIPKAITKAASDYYYDDVYDNEGKSLLPNR